MREKSLKKQLTSFVIKNQEDIYRYAFSYVKNKDDALDIVQESIQKALMKINTLKDAKAIKTWFYRIVTNTALDVIRKKKKLQVTDEETLTYLSSGENDVYQDVDLNRALHDLPTEDRVLIILRYYKDFKLSEIAATLDLNVNTVKTRLYRVIGHLRSRIEDSEEEGK
ncbi:sigma-70 family RNA polymerase sigma factor [Bacillus spongiae]|uniref:Sigma-70 family RNA polymerase sigma factor n=1 Tax=Bacillus spongiae TaxID=2683610 RepID=A0ABU8H8E9_9BACI